MGSYEFEIAQPAKGTLHWLLSKPEYVRWKEGKSSSLLWITGYIGCGKTTIALYISNVLVSLRQPYGIICRYFCDEREKSHDASALLRALIFQIVTCHRRFLKIVKKALDRGGIHILRQVDTLWDIFAQIACDNKVASISVIIDGIEGYERRTQAMLVGRISELLRSDKAANVKFLITSRPNLAALRSIDASSAQVILLRLEDEQEMIGKDVNLFIHQQLQVLVDRDGCTPATRDILEEVLVSKADRTFLWISLVLPLLEERFVVATDIQSVTDLLPLDLTLAYERLLYLIPSSDRKMVGRLLCLIAVSARPLSGDELSILLAILMGHRTALALQDDQLPMDNRMICAALGPLIRVCGSKISFVHPSLTKYLISLSSSTHSLSTSFGIDVQRDTMELVTACMHYLSLDEFKDDLFQRSESSDDDSPSSDAFEGPVLDEDSLFIFDLYREPMFRDKQEMYLEASIQIAKRYKLFDYASLHWATDFLRCDGSASLEASEVASLLCGYDEARLTNWLRYFWIAKGFTEPCLPADPLIVACYFGHSDTLYQYLDSSQDDQDEIISACLFWSAREGHTSCVQAILRHSTSIPMHGISPLSVAAQYGHVDTVLALIQDGRFDLNAPGDTGRTALSLASENGHCDVVALLLSHKAIDVNLPGKYKYTAVFWAVLAMSFRTFTHFLTDKRVDLNHLDEQGRTLLSLAAEQGAVDIVRSLVRSTRVRIENRDVKGRTPISYAAQYGHLEVVIILLTKQQTQASVQDNTGRNAHSWAASQPNSDVLHKLLTFDPKGADVEDSSGWPALAWAMKPPGYPDNVTELVHSLEVNINRKDKVNSRTPLSWAASYGFFSIAHTLSVSSGILLDLEDASGRTPLSHASSNGNINVVALLLSRDGVNINSTDHNGCTPLSWAAREGSCEVILFLLSHPRIDCSIRDVLGRSPRDIALEFGHEKAADIIQATSKTM
jgi:ankyrin repeat protein